MQALTSTSPAHVIAVDDDPHVLDLISSYLGDHDFRVSTATNESEMTGLMARDSADIVVLDLRLAREDGLQIARRLRERSKIPIIILTGRLDEADRVMGLELGADDYVTKPFSPRELLARVRALLRRTRMHERMSDTLASVRAYRFAGWELNIRLRRLTSPLQRTVTLSNSEFNLLVAFLTAPRTVLDRERLLESSRLYNAEVFDRAIDVQVGRLRRKIEPDPKSPTFILTARGKGYSFEALVDVLRG
ncbi:response regulator [Variovorax sp. J31P207]|uniref:response regulator n=1 Tax=Variovorax sp. J31P207 TaxID=3053510 RepID=UPI0025782CA9|nr:response regulator [Variovorax sp. J31P207]MDM0066294.1 response regulator [Variovorax sp. J31P207]